ncbi:hypothetical protein OJ253_2654 [Cryptosporidium canis]|uniref:Signal peptide-containing protein n=1 Tax=Cryptosporidium canis TaxID=195482 RepID=A0A9D5HWK3_9CRYT|nr:hypothetical protein OJ253_2654 [Cryptosporidium canis]
MKVSALLFILVIQGLLLTRVNSCEIDNLDINDEESCKDSFLDISEAISLNQFETLKLNGLVFDSIGFIIDKIRLEFEKEHKKYLIKSQESMAFINSISVDERINNYLENSNIISGEEIKDGVLQILKNYRKSEKGSNLNSSNRFIHSEILDDQFITPPIHGFIHLDILPNENI